MNILALSGSLRKESFNTKLIRAFQTLAPAEMKIEMADIGGLPLFNEDLEATFPAEAHALKVKIEAADGILLATPEYNRSIPGVLKNAIDWASRPYGHNSFKGKPVLVAGIGYGGIGAAIAQTHLRIVMQYLDTDTIAQPELYLGPAQGLFDAEGNMADDTTKELLTRALTALAEKCSARFS